MEPSVPDQLGALAHPKRLEIFRLLMRRYPDRVPAGEIAQALDLRANTTSVYLSTLRQAGLITQTRRGTFQLYAVELDAVRAMFGTLLSDCCQNRPDICMPNAGLIGAAEDARNTRPKVLFVCSQNSARSIMAEALLRQLGPQFDVYSAGLTETDGPDPVALNVLRDNNIPLTDQLRSKSIRDFQDLDAPEMDIVITVCDVAANEDCGHWPGAPLHAHWSIPDPRSHTDPDAKLAATRHAFSILQTKLTALADMAVAQSDPAAVQVRLDAIARLGQPR